MNAKLIVVIMLTFASAASHRLYTCTDTLALSLPFAELSTRSARPKYDLLKISQVWHSSHFAKAR